MRFAWIRNSSASGPRPAASTTDRWITIVYNVAWWIPVVFTVIGVVSPSTGFVAFLAVTMVRAIVNLYRNNVLPVDRAERFPLRSP